MISPVVTTPSGRVILGSDSPTAFAGPLTCQLLLDGQTTGGFSAVKHTLAPHTLGAPLHRHSREREFSIITAGRITALLNDAIVEANVGDVIVKPQGQWHTFWNAGDTSAELIELIVPGGFETYFVEMDALLRASAVPDLAAIAALAERFGLDVRPESIPDLCGTHGLAF